MSSIQERLAAAKAKANAKTANIFPGRYHSRVAAVEEDHRYLNGAIRITYELQGQNQMYTYSEIFICDPNNDRTCAFYKYLLQNGINTEEEFIGAKEEIDLRWNFTKTGTRLLTIADRTFLGF